METHTIPNVRQRRLPHKCPVCLGHFQTQQGMRSHCTKMHGYQSWKRQQMNEHEDTQDTSTVTGAQQVQRSYRKIRKKQATRRAARGVTKRYKPFRFSTICITAKQ